VTWRQGVRGAEDERDAQHDGQHGGVTSERVINAVNRPPARAGPVRDDRPPPVLPAPFRPKPLRGRSG
jgi:hypothetical protein